MQSAFSQSLLRARAAIQAAIRPSRSVQLLLLDDLGGRRLTAVAEHANCWAMLQGLVRMELFKSIQEEQDRSILKKVCYSVWQPVVSSQDSCALPLTLPSSMAMWLVYKNTFVRSLSASDIVRTHRLLLAQLANSLQSAFACSPLLLASNSRLQV